MKQHSLYISAKGNNPGNARKLVCIPADTGYRAEVTLLPGQTNSGGLLLSYNDKAFTGVMVNESKYMVYDTARNYKEIPRRKTGPVTLRIDNHREHCTFSVSDDGKNWTILANDVVVSGLQHNNYKGFLALKIALSSAGEGDVKFNNFRYTPFKAR